MRGEATKQARAFFYFSPEERVPSNHPLRGIKALMDTVLKRLEPTFAEMYSETGRPSVPPETLLKASMLMALYSVRSERQFCEQLDYNILFRWFLDMGLEEPSFVSSTFSKNRERLLKHEVSRTFLAEVVTLIREHGLASDEHFTVDGTLIESWASLKSFSPKDGPPPPSDDDPGNPSINFKGVKRANSTHKSTTDPEARIAKKGPGYQAKMCHMGHVLMENRNGFCMDVTVTEANLASEHDAALDMVDRMKDKVGFTPKTLGADKNYFETAFVQGLRDRKIIPHIAVRTRRPTVDIDRRTTRHDSYAVSQRKRKRIEECFGWFKTYGGMRKMRFVGRRLTLFWMEIVAGTHNLLRMKNILSFA